MKKRVVVPLAAIAVAVILAVVLGIIAARQRARRHRVFRAAPAETRPAPPKQPTSPREIDQWSEQFRELEARGQWDDLAELLDAIARSHPAEYAQWSLGYLHARALLENDEPKKAQAKLAPFVAAGAFRDVALYHQAEIDDARDDHAAASRNRQALIFGAPSSPYRDEAIDDETEHLAAAGDATALNAFAARLFPTASTARRRDLTAHLVELSIRRGDANGGLARGLALLQAGTLDDPADRVSRALDRPELIRRLNGPQLVMMGESMQSHRHFDRAVALLSSALRTMPQKRDDLTFAIGRSQFGSEQFAAAQQTYLRGAAATPDVRWKSTFLWHAARAAQLQGDDRTAEQLMTQVIALPGKFASTGPALTQRIRTRTKQRRFAEAAGDLAFVRKGWKDHTVVEATLAYALGMLGAGQNGAALAALNSIPRNLLDKFEPYEIDYWRARALEASNPPAAFAAYLGVLRASQPTHFAYFARQRLDSAAMQPKLREALATRDAEIARLTAAGNWVVAKQVATDRLLLSSAGHEAQLQRLAAIYAHIPEYAAIHDLQPDEFPRFPLPPTADRASLLMAMGLFDEAADEVQRRYALRPLKSALTKSLALNRGNASKESIFAIEILMNSVPRDYVPELLPLTVRQLLYPRYFYGFITEDARRFGADPALVLAIMREESRFNPRAKSEAAARGLLQFIITTARQIGREAGFVDVEPEDLYDPRVIIRLGAKYISTLSKEFGDDHYNVAASYNAGPKQTALWSRLAGGSGDDFFLSAVSFDETKHYVRKVMNSYKRYVEIYGDGAPSGGIRPEP